MSKRTVTSVWGIDAANELAAIAIDLLCYPPEKIATYSTRIPASEIRHGREILERHGIHWRALHAAQQRQFAEVKERVHDA